MKMTKGKWIELGVGIALVGIGAYMQYKNPDPEDNSWNPTKHNLSWWLIPIGGAAILDSFNIVERIKDKVIKK